MKKICTLLLTILLLLSATSALAAEAKPGETVTVSIRVGANAAMFWNCSVSYDNSVLEFVSGQAELDSAQFNSGAMSFIGSGSDATVGTLTFRVKSTAAAGKTSVSASGTGDAAA